MTHNSYDINNLSKIGLNHIQYSLLKKYFVGAEHIIQAHTLFTEEGLSFHKQIFMTELSDKIFKKEGVKMFGQKLPFKDVDFSKLHPTKSGKNAQYIKHFVNNPETILGKGCVINIYSLIGNEATQLASLLTQKLLQISKGYITNGVEINKQSVDFDGGDKVEDFVKKDFITIFSVDSIYSTEFRDNFLNNIYDLAKLKNIPIIRVSKKEFKNNTLNVINLKLTDTVKTEEQLMFEFINKNNEEK